MSKQFDREELERWAERCASWKAPLSPSEQRQHDQSHALKLALAVVDARRAGDLHEDECGECMSHHDWYCKERMALFKQEYEAVKACVDAGLVK